MIISYIEIKNDDRSIDVNFSCKRATRNLSIKKTSSVRVMYQKYWVDRESSRAYQSSGVCGASLHGNSVTSWCNPARSGPHIIFT